MANWTQAQLAKSFSGVKPSEPNFEVTFAMDAALSVLLLVDVDLSLDFLQKCISLYLRKKLFLKITLKVVEVYYV